MKRITGIMGIKTAQRILAKAEKRRAALWEQLADLEVLITGLKPLLPMSLEAAEDSPRVPERGQEPDSVASLDPVVEESETVGPYERVEGCDWATGTHTHRIVGDDSICLAPEIQWRQPKAF